MQHFLAASTEVTIDLPLLLKSQSLKALSFENRGATLVHILPGLVPAAPLPDTIPPSQNYSPTPSLARLEWVVKNGYSVPAGERLTMTSTKDYSLPSVWTAVSSGVTNNDLFSIPVYQ